MWFISYLDHKLDKPSHFHVSFGTWGGFICLYFIEVYLIYNVVLVSAVQQSDSVIYLYIFSYAFCYGFSQDTEYIPCAIQ